MNAVFQYGIDTLVLEHAEGLAGRRVGLVAHPASAGADGVPSAERLRAAGVELACLFGPEHGFSGRGGAGENIAHRQHPDWHIPVYSLYGETRRPTAEMLRDLDVIVFDLQDLGARPYTYVSTLRYVLEAAAEHGKTVIVADRPSPLAGVVDGPMLEPEYGSFVGAVRTPVAYGMTPAETALWLQRDLGLRLDLRLAPMLAYRRAFARPAGWPAWIPPSPAIRTWECGLCFPVTVFFEALPAVDHGRGTATPFQLCGAPWINSELLCERLNALELPGVRFAAESYRAMTGLYEGQPVHGVRIEITETARFQPVHTGVAVIRTLQELYGRERLWAEKGTRPDFFDKLMGTASARLALQSGEPASVIAASWENGISAFRETRAPCLLYPPAS